MGCASSKPAVDSDDRPPPQKAAPAPPAPPAKPPPPAAAAPSSSTSIADVDVSTEELAAHQERDYKGSIKPACEEDRMCTLKSLAVIGTVCLVNGVVSEEGGTRS